MIILGIETSCDETGIALVKDGKDILCSLVSSQISLHAPFGGVVPEIASRAHLETILPLLDQCFEQANIQMKDVDGIAVTQKPGLIGSLLIGVSAAKSLAFVHQKPLVGVDHVEAHVYSPMMDNAELEYPFLSMVVSGGHTSLYRAREPGKTKLLGQTVDDAAGEAFDKVAALLGLPYPGGPAIEKEAQNGSTDRYQFKVPQVNGQPLHFSFSGIKTSVLYKVRGQDGKCPAPENIPHRADLAASFQDTAVRSLTEKALLAATQEGLSAIGVGGGVACNQKLREELTRKGQVQGIQVYFPSKRLCIDNGAMIAGLGYHLLRQGQPASLEMDASAR